ncbi:hypothetical protein b3_0247 [Synechococcus phage B3]|nr:hypothetical protein b3_0247 [Synechococcus phage B3]QGT54855.1 hypothetical protein b23_0241 [Synechococcus phage B23]
MLINPQAMENLTKNVDWAETIQELNKNNPASYESLLNLLFSSVQPVYKIEIEQDYNPVKTIDSRLIRTYDFVVTAVKNTVNGSCTDNSKISAIKALRSEFDVNLKNAKDCVEKMMQMYKNNPDCSFMFYYKTGGDLDISCYVQ